MQDFWFVSNIAFAIGVVSAEYEDAVRKAVDKAWIPLLAAGSVGMALAVRSGLDENIAVGRTEEQLLWMETGATVVWSLLVMLLAAKCRIRGRVMGCLGKSSLYLYLTHTYIFMWFANFLEMELWMRFLASAVVTVAVSMGCRLVIGWGMKKLARG